MRSRTARDNANARTAQILAMTPDARVALLARLSEQGPAAFMSAHGVDRATAIARIKATRRLGRRPSAAACDEP
jgi:hypothetical protein